MDSPGRSNMPVTGLRRPPRSAGVRVCPPEFAYILPTRRAAGAARRRQRSGTQRRRPSLRPRFRVVGFRPLASRRYPGALPRPRSAAAQGIWDRSADTLPTRSRGPQLLDRASGHDRGPVKHRQPNFDAVASGVLPFLCLHLYVETQRSRGQRRSDRVRCRRCGRRPRRRPGSHDWGGASWRG